MNGAPLSFLTVFRIGFPHNLSLKQRMGSRQATTATATKALKTYVSLEPLIRMPLPATVTALLPADSCWSMHSALNAFASLSRGCFLSNFFCIP